MSFLRRWILVLLALVLIVPLGACDLEDFRVQAAQGDQLVASVTTEPKTFNYALNQSSPNVFGFIYEGLITENGMNGDIEPALAESWKISEDKLKIVFTLREGLKWSDGAPLTADDVVFTYNDIYLNEKIPTDLRDALMIGEQGLLPKVRKVNDRRVEFTIPEPFAPFLRVTGIPILPAHSLRESVETMGSDGNPKFVSMWGVETDPNKIIVNGPFRIAGYQTSQRVVFRRNPYYWRKGPQGRPQPYIERFVWQIVESTDTSLLQFRSGGLDAVSVSASNFSLLKREEKRSNFTIYNGGITSGQSFISFNLNKGQRNGRPLVNPIKSRWFNTVAFRQAIAYGIDRQTMINNLFRGLGEPQDSPLSVQSPYYLSPKEGLKVYNYNPDKSRELLKGAGFKYNSNGQLLDADGNRVRFTLLSNTGSPTVEAIGAQIKRDLSKIGIQVDFALIDFGTLVDKLGNTLDWESYFGSFTGGVEPNDGANLWLPDGGLHTFNQKPLPGQAPITGREVADWEAEISRLYIQGAQELDEAKRKEIYAKTQQLTQEYLPLIHMINPLALVAFRNNIKGVRPSGLGGALWNIHEIKVTEE